jgi:uncharacterized RDD family membrane protein YckC
MPRKERTWRDEVEERVARRRKKRTQSSLPLFEQPAVAAVPEPEAPVAAAPSVVEPPVVESPTIESPVVENRVLVEPERGLHTRIVPMDFSPGGPLESEFEAAPLSEEELADLPLRQAEPPVSMAVDEDEPEIPEVRADLPADGPAFDERFLGSDDDDELVSLSPPPAEPEPLERPARVSERVQAAAVDAGILVVLGILVLYFTGRAARVDVLSLGASWPWIAAYLAFLGLFYAGYFTGTTGQTPGKMMTGLRVVNTRGRPPGYLRASLRAGAGALGAALGGVGLIPMALDPARRALHDRLASTRVVNR